jgi:hypothetical protein
LVLASALRLDRLELGVYLRDRRADPDVPAQARRAKPPQRRAAAPLEVQAVLRRGRADGSARPLPLNLAALWLETPSVSVLR